MTDSMAPDIVQVARYNDEQVDVSDFDDRNLKSQQHQVSGATDSSKAEDIIVNNAGPVQYNFQIGVPHPGFEEQGKNTKEEPVVNDVTARRSQRQSVESVVVVNADFVRNEAYLKSNPDKKKKNNA
ncbi:hypothetical protein V6N11_047357 [Hibiscus sabdariffa]|uniref:Uncharacterized protein n=2 Tax=Hibiscus sabdariffa TaxID=183260 RepID=A0ABR2B7W1_9ROSI